MRSIQQLMDLTGRRALITGGAGHIGYAAAEALTELGARTALVDLNASACIERAARLNANGRELAIPVACDLADPEGTRMAVRDSVRQLGGLDIVIHSAAFVGTTQVPGWAVPFEQQTVQAWDAGVRINLTSAFVIAQEAQQALAASGHGSIIFVSSIYGHVGSDMSLYEGTQMSRVAAYSASKGGLLQLMRHLASVFAPSIRVNTISPGGIARSQPEKFRLRYEARTPLKRMGTEEDLKGAFAYLASDLSAYVTGQDLLVDGGWTAW